MTQPNVYRGCIYPDAPPVEFSVTQAAADAKAIMWFRRGFSVGAALGGGAVILAFWATTAFAGDTASWMGTGCTLVPVADQPHVAEVRCRNVSTSGSSYTAGDMVADGLTVNVAILHGPGDVPDNFTITPMPGFYADPASLTLDENSRGVAFIFEWVGS